MLKQTLFLGVLALVGANFSFAQEAKAPEKAADKKAELAEKATLSEAQQTAAKLLLYSIIFSEEAGDLVEIPREGPRTGYNGSVKTTALAPVTLVIGGVTIFMSAQSFEAVKIALPFIKVLIKASAEAMKASGDMIEASAKAIKLDWSSEQSGKSFDFAWKNFIRPTLDLMYKFGVHYSAGSAAGTSLLFSSGYSSFNNSEDILTHEMARSLLGYNKALNTSLEAKLKELGGLYDIPAEKLPILKRSMRDALVAEAERNQFRRDAKYDLDLVKLMGEKEIISKPEYEASQAMGELVRRMSEYSSP